MLLICASAGVLSVVLVLVLVGVSLGESARRDKARDMRAGRGPSR